MMILAVLLLINNLGLFILEVIGYNLCHSVVMLLDGYYHLCQAILCTVRIVSLRIQSVYTSRHTYGLARVGVVGELVAFVSFLSLSVSVFLETVKHLIDVVFIIPKRESNSSKVLSAHGHEHIHSLIDHPEFILGVGVYATVSNCLLGAAIIYSLVKRSRKLQQAIKQRRPSLPQSLPKHLSKSLLITDTLPIHHSFLQVLNMLLGPLAIFTCGILLVMLGEVHHVRLIYTRLVDPSICCLLFISYIIMIYIPVRDVMHLVLQAKPSGLKSDEIEKRLVETISGIVGVHELHIWRLTPQKTLATVHIVFNTTEDILSKYQDIIVIFQTFYIDHVTIQPEFSLTSNEIEKFTCLYQCSKTKSKCSPLQCCDHSSAITDQISEKPKSPGAVHFHRRSSAGLPSEEEKNESDSEEESTIIASSK